jgi:hypothetical protein
LSLQRYLYRLGVGPSLPFVESSMIGYKNLSGPVLGWGVCCFAASNRSLAVFDSIFPMNEFRLGEWIIAELDATAANSCTRTGTFYDRNIKDNRL